MEEDKSFKAEPLTVLQDMKDPTGKVPIIEEAASGHPPMLGLTAQKSTMLMRFSGETKNTLGEIYLPTYVEGVSSYERFGVLDCLSSNNAILGRPWIHNVRAIPSTYHQCVKITTIKGEQKSAQECYTKSLKPSKAETQMETNQVILDPEYPDRHVLIVSDVLDNIRPELTVQQKRRKFAPERNSIINEEVDKRLGIGMIREVMYPEWIANVVGVQKKNGKWRVCVDYKDLNKACPKDPFPLPHIDAMVDATTGHELLMFMDASSGFNQIKMHLAD
ncbi:uncharacterized protein LOC141641191 [Silene latifolia]|uniref:uncharacterized protein LOC141641191 n=1 Tax=Silene latifolia TaxID=37657 RepID=UPI003D77FC3F